MPEVETYHTAEIKKSMAGHKTILERSMHELWQQAERIATNAHHDILQTGGTRQEAIDAYRKILNWIDTKL